MAAPPTDQEFYLRLGLDPAKTMAVFNPALRKIERILEGRPRTHTREAYVECVTKVVRQLATTSAMPHCEKPKVE
eukprot:5692765-Pyramimonas_sp.AAC.1